MLFNNSLESILIYEILESFSRATKQVYFIQVGCCDGVAGDPLHDLIVKDQWSGILIEPVKYLFERLEANYQECSNLIFRNIAISNEDSSRDFWYLRENTDALPFWYEQLGSFLPEVILKSNTEIPNIKDYLVSEKVDCLTLETLIEQHNIEKIDLFHTDVEGYDFEIIKQIDFEKFHPAIVMYEHKHLTESDKEESRNYLKSKGYTVIYDHIDTLGFIGNFVEDRILEKLNS